MLFLLMIVLPFVELALLLNVGERIGPAWTLLSVIGTGVVGAHLARREGLKTMLALQKRFRRGRCQAVYSWEVRSSSRAGSF